MQETRISSAEQFVIMPLRREMKNKQKSININYNILLCSLKPPRRPIEGTNSHWQSDEKNGLTRVRKHNELIYYVVR